MLNIKPSNIAERIFPTTTWSYPERKEEIFLTFDDGPVPENTPWLLDMLNDYGAKATFFLIGKNVEKYPYLYERILKEGHSVGNHTYSHVSGWKLGLEKYLEDIALAQKFVDSNLFRPPYGKITPLQLKHLKKEFNVVFWDVLSYDFSQKISQEKCLVNVLSKYKDGSIIVFHDSVKASKNLRYTLPRVLDHFKNLDYKFATIK
ncbi:MAG: polysaccharide deacetylase family protein [Salinivirgaceae bacterium]|nr:MAG: polysaccharide deacetylase family protein [Salinivirgaceae bacterium]